MGSKYVRQIVSSVNNYTDNWYMIKSPLSHESWICPNGITNGVVRITNYGNGPFLPIETVYIDGKEVPTTYFDRWSLSVAIKNWFKRVDLNHLSK